jgi:hypothetical protein
MVVAKKRAVARFFATPHVKSLMNKISLKTLLQYLFADTRRWRRRSRDIGASMKRFERV